MKMHGKTPVGTHLMKRRFPLRLLVRIAAGALLIALGCSRRTQLGPVVTETRSVALESAKSVGIDLGLGAGELYLSPGDGELLEAQFTRNSGLEKPEIKYTVADDRGALVVRQPPISKTFGNVASSRAYKNKWELRVKRGVPLDLSIELGAGKVDLTLSGLALNSAKINYGAAVGRIDLGGDWERSVEVSIKGGIGTATIRLPSKVGAKVDLEGGLGAVDAYDFTRRGNSYVNSAYGASPVTVLVRLEAGIGAVNLEQGR